MLINKLEEILIPEQNFNIITNKIKTIILENNTEGKDRNFISNHYLIVISLL